MAGDVVAPGDFAAQASKAFENLIIALTASGAGLDDVIFTRVLVASSSRSDLGTVWDVVCTGFGTHAPPSTLTGVTVLGYPEQLVEIEAVAAVAD